MKDGSVQGQNKQKHMLSSFMRAHAVITAAHIDNVRVQMVDSFFFFLFLKRLIKQIMSFKNSSGMYKNVATIKLVVTLALCCGTQSAVLKSVDVGWWCVAEFTTCRANFSSSASCYDLEKTVFATMCLTKTKWQDNNAPLYLEPHSVDIYDANVLLRHWNGFIQGVKFTLNYCICAAYECYTRRHIFEYFLDSKVSAYTLKIAISHSAATLFGKMFHCLLEQTKFDTNSRLQQESERGRKALLCLWTQHGCSFSSGWS